MITTFVKLSLIKKHISWQKPVTYLAIVRTYLLLEEFFKLYILQLLVLTSCVRLVHWIQPLVGLLQMMNIIIYSLIMIRIHGLLLITISFYSWLNTYAWLSLFKHLEEVLVGDVAFVIRIHSTHQLIKLSLWHPKAETIYHILKVLPVHSPTFILKISVD